MIRASMIGARPAANASLTEIERRLTDGMRDETGILKDELRRAVTAAGLPDRLAKTWQGETYPKGKTSMSPAGFVWSEAPRIIASFDAGSTIRSRTGRYLAIPTENVPASRSGPSRGQRRPMSVEEVESAFNQDLTLRKGRNGSILGFAEVVASRASTQGGRIRGGRFRRATKGRLAQGRKTELVLMFVFVRQAKMPKLFDLEAVANAAGARLAARYMRELG